MNVYVIVDGFEFTVDRVFKYKYKAEDYLKSKGLKLFNKTFWAKRRDNIDENNYYEIASRRLRE